MHFQLTTFDDLTREQLYAILRLRSQVFVVEQQSLYLDMDGLDQDALHLLQMDGEAVAGYARIQPPGQKYPEPCIGRIVIAREYRGSGHGRALMDKALQVMRETYGRNDVRIEAQTYLQRFYEGYGFAVVKGPYILDGIDHVEMLKPGA